MKPSGRLALLLSLVLGFGLSFSGLAHADHDLSHNHPFCGQGGEFAEAGAGGTDVGDTILEARGVEAHFADTDAFDAPQSADEILVPEHLAARLGEDNPEDENGDGFVVVAAPNDIETAGTDAGRFHGGHGGGPGGGQGGSTFFGAGDGGCESELAFEPARRRLVRPPGHLPVTGSFAGELTYLGLLFLAAGAASFLTLHVLRAKNAAQSLAGR